MSVLTEMKSRYCGWALLSSVLVALLGAACQRPAEPLATADASYEVQGTIQRLGGRQNGFDEVVVKHQSLGDFRDREGAVVGMESMAMPFAVAPGVALEGIETGDPVTFRFEVRWENDPVLLITELTELPAGTVVSFEDPVAEPSADPEGMPHSDAVEQGTAMGEVEMDGLEPQIEPPSGSEASTDAI